MLQAAPLGVGGVEWSVLTEGGWGGEETAGLATGGGGAERAGAAEGGEAAGLWVHPNIEIRNATRTAEITSAERSVFMTRFGFGLIYS
ncbi:MAG: hypothetical protein KGH63_01845, partial [Candidatus Micrarchaeota archaeon]|nr:hypothetical protein [Candidatus Micrarchaeota archaeon]